MTCYTPGGPTLYNPPFPTFNRCREIAAGRMVGSQQENEAIADAMAQRCNSLLPDTSDRECRTFLSNPLSHGKMDQYATSYCRMSGIGTRECACINSDMPCPLGLDDKCIDGGYVTVNIANSTGCTVENTSQYVAENPFSFSFGNIIAQVTDGEASKYVTVIIIVFALLIILVIAVAITGYFIFTSKN